MRIEYTRFIRAMSNDPIFRKDNPEEFTPHVREVFAEIRRRGEDPLEAMEKAYDFVDQQVRARQKHAVDEDAVLKKGNPKKVGTFTWWVYLRVMTRKIVGKLADEKLSGALQIN